MFKLKDAAWVAPVLLTACQSEPFVRQELPAAQDARPNIILVMADDQGYGDTGYTGHPFVQTPHLDDMAEHAVVFHQFHAAAPLCSPTRASVMTGRHPIRGNVPSYGHYLRPHEHTLAEALQDAGYLTSHFGKWHIGSIQPDSPTSPGQVVLGYWVSGLNFFDRDPYLCDNGTYRQLEGQGTTLVMDEALAFLEANHQEEQPMFCVIWLPSPHDPHVELPEHDQVEALYEGEAHRGYFLEITLLDQQVGRLRQALREMEIEDNTLLWYCSDNGGLVEASSGGRGKKGSVYEGGLRVPALLEWPGRYDAQEVDVPVTTSDMYPTLLAIAGAEVVHQPRLDGIDITPILEGEQSQRPAIGFWHGFARGDLTASDAITAELLAAQQAGQPTPWPERLLKNVNDFPDHPDDLSHGHAAWLDWPWKLHRIENAGQVRLELYRLDEDPMESQNLAEQHPQRVTQMRQTLEAWQASVVQSHEGRDYQAVEFAQ